MSKLTDNIKDSFNHIGETLAHKREVTRIGKELFGRSFLLHDLDKVALYILVPWFGTRWISKFHRRYSSHHPGSMTFKSLEEAICDWESARFTKPDKPLTARQTCLKYYPELKDTVIPVCDRLGI